MGLYTFPYSKLKRRTTQASADPLVLVACGSFSPVTLLHVEMFQMAAHYVQRNTNFEIVGNYLSPVGCPSVGSEEPGQKSTDPAALYIG